MKRVGASLVPLLVAVGSALVLVLLWKRYGAEGFESASSATTTVSDTATAAPFKSTWTDVLINPPVWLVWLIVILAILGVVIGFIMSTYNWYRGVSAGIGAVSNLSSAGSNWMRAKARETNRSGNNPA